MYAHKTTNTNPVTHFLRESWMRRAAALPDGQCTMHQRDVLLPLRVQVLGFFVEGLVPSEKREVLIGTPAHGNNPPVLPGDPLTTIAK